MTLTPPRTLSAALVLAILLGAAGCTAPVSAPRDACPANLSAVIRPGLDRYAPVMSTAPGLPLTAVMGSLNTSTCGYRYRWEASDGMLLTWDAPDYRVIEHGRVLETESPTVYWSWEDPELPLSTPAVTLTLAVLGPAGDRIAGTATLTIGWEEGGFAVPR